MHIYILYILYIMYIKYYYIYNNQWHFRSSSISRVSGILTSLVLFERKKIQNLLCYGLANLCDTPINS